MGDFARSMEGSCFETVSEVIPGFLFIGGLATPSNVGFLTDRGVRYALNVSDDVPRAPVDHYLQIKVADTVTEDLARYWDDTTAFIDRARSEGVAIVVYDTTGVSRAPAFVLAYLMVKEQLLLREGLYILKEARRWVNPNMHFMSTLSDLELKVLGVRSVLVVHEDREKAHLEFPENVELPSTGKGEPASSSEEDEKKKRKKKKKEKKKRK